MLYNLQEDPREMVNLIGANPQRAKYLPQAEVVRHEMLAWMGTVDHPLLADLAKATLN